MDIYTMVDSLQYENKAMRQEIAEFRNGKRYKKLQEDYRRVVDGYIRENKQLKKELEAERTTRKRVRNIWFEQCDNDWDRYQKELEEKEKQILKLEERYWKLQVETDEKIAAIKRDYETLLDEKDVIIEELKSKFLHAEALLDRDGTNTGTPTSNTPLNKNKVIPNGRRGSGKTKGGQVGHEQHTLKPPEDSRIDETIDHPVEPDEVCPRCGSDHLRYTGESEKKYEYDVVIKVVKRKHNYWIYECIDCGELVRTHIDPKLHAECQYGAMVQALVLSLMNTVNGSMNKTAMFIRGITGDELHPSEGYIAKVQANAAKGLKRFYSDLRILLLTLAILYWDDTVIFINTARACFRFYGDENVAYYTAHLHKDLEGLKEDNVLPLLTGNTKVMHDHNTVNYNEQFSFENLECNQHMQRDGKKNTADTGHSWSTDLSEHIGNTIKDRNDAINANKDGFDQDYIRRFYARLKEIQDLGEEQYQADAERLEKYGAPFERSLLNRIEKFKSNYFAWVEDFSLPTTNNLSERGLRQVKTKMKVSGQFESEAAARNYAIILSYVETCRRNNINEIDALRRLCEGNPYTVHEIFGI